MGAGGKRQDGTRKDLRQSWSMVITHFFALAFLDPLDHSASSTAAFFESSAAFLPAAASAFLACPAAFLLFSPAPPPFLAIFMWGCV